MFNVNLKNNWQKVLAQERQKNYFIKLTDFLEKAYKNSTIYPEKNKIFYALQLTPPEQCKTLILGQDPYHNPNQAHGLAFSVKTLKIPPSLKNILKELKNSTNITKNKGDLTNWAKEGVLLLNSILTVQKNLPQSHKKIGWQKFTDEIILKLNENKNPIAFLLWGNFAKSKARLIKNPKHLILTAPHPSPLSAHKGFFGCDHFNKTNQFLKLTNQKPINWQS